MTLQFPLVIYGWHTSFLIAHFLVRNIRHSTNITLKYGMTGRHVTLKKAKIKELQTSIALK